MLTPGTILQSRYQILEQLGAGGMGTVYKAEALRLNTVVALKETHFTEERLRKQFEREAQLLAGLRHPALPRVIDHFDEGDGLYLVMDFIEGKDLAEMLALRAAPFPPQRVLCWADQLLDALNYLHEQATPIIHRDIKPQNLKVTGKDQIVLLDFGLAKGFAGEISRVTTSGSIFGYTPNYAPLEQIQGTGTDPRSDLYSLGATIYHLMTGAVPTDVLTRLTETSDGNEDPLRPAQDLNAVISPQITSVLNRALAIGRNHRFATAAEMHEDLKLCAAEYEARLTPPPTTVTPAQSELIGREDAGSTVQSASEAALDTQPAPTAQALASAPVPTLRVDRPIFQAPVFEVRTKQSRRMVWLLGGVISLFLIVGAVLTVVALQWNSNKTPTSSANAPAIVKPRMSAELVQGTWTVPRYTSGGYREEQTLTVKQDGTFVLTTVQTALKTEDKNLEGDSEYRGQWQISNEKLFLNGQTFGYIRGADYLLGKPRPAPQRHVLSMLNNDEMVVDETDWDTLLGLGKELMRKR